MPLQLTGLRRFASLLLAPIVLLNSVSSSCATKDSPPSIVNFHPTNFEGRADAPFFYSIGGELKYSDSIDPNALTLFRGKIWQFQVSPDGKRITIVSDHELMVVDEFGRTQNIGTVDSIDRALKPIGRSFIRDSDFQWSPDSKGLYFIKDRFYPSKGLQLFSEFGELWRFDAESGGQQLIVKPFRAFQIIFGRGPDIYFAVPMANGDLELELFDGNTVRDVMTRAAYTDSRGESGVYETSPFYSFSSVDYMQKVLPGTGVRQSFDFKANRQTLVFDERPLLELTRYCDWLDGCGDCNEMVGSVFLPGRRFFLLNVPYCHNYKGELLIDTQTGSYKALPRETRVFVTANTKTYPHYRFNHEGISVE